MTSLLQKINDLNVRVDNVSTSGGGGTTDTTALQAQVDTNTTDISGIQNNKQNTLIAGDNITITGDTISASGGGTSGTAETLGDQVFYAVTSVSSVMSSIGTVYVSYFDTIQKQIRNYIHIQMIHLLF